MMKTQSFLVCALCVSLVHAQASYRLYHRLWSPSTPQPPFSLRANIHTSHDSIPVLVDSDSAGQLVLDPSQLQGSLYQIALGRDGGVSENDWQMSSVKACYVIGMELDTIRLHLSQSQKAYAMDYFVHPVPHDGSCPKKGPSVRTSISFANTTVIINIPGVPASPELRPPPQLSPTGEPVQPQPESSFLQKYWMYIALGLVTLMVTGGGMPEEEQGGRNNGQAQGRASSGRAAGR